MPFMRVQTYWTRYFATLGPSELQPPLAKGSIQCFHISCSLYSTWQASDPILHFTILQSPVFLLNSSRSHLRATIISSNKGPPSPEVIESICRVPST